jgi:UV DNA damage endonuclease
MSKLGYCCINLSLNVGVKDKDRIYTNRSMSKKSFQELGIKRASELALRNVADLEKIIEWNESAGIKMYRMSSDMFPWCSEYEFTDLPDYDQILRILSRIGGISRSYGQRLTFHPSPYSVIASLREDVKANAIKELRQHGEIMDMMGLEKNHHYPINIHINTIKPDKQSAADRFCQAFSEIPESARLRLVLENDDKPNQFTPIDLYEMVHKRIGIPLTFDYLHYYCNPAEGVSEEEALRICVSTWPKGITPITHFSDSKKINEDSSSKLLAHSDWIWTPKIETYGLSIDTELEVKQKDLALLKYLEVQNGKR